MNTMLIARRTVMMMMMMMVMVAKNHGDADEMQWHVMFAGAGRTMAKTAASISNKTNSILPQLHDPFPPRSFRQPQHIAGGAVGNKHNERLVRLYESFPPRERHDRSSTQHLCIGSWRA